MSFPQDAQLDEFQARLTRIRKGEGLVAGAVAPLEGRSLAKAKMKDQRGVKHRKKNKPSVFGLILASICGVVMVFLGDYVVQNHMDALNKFAGIQADIPPQAIPYAVAGTAVLILMLMLGMRNKRHMMGAGVGVAAMTVGQPVMAEVLPAYVMNMDADTITAMIKAQMQAFKFDVTL